MANAELESSADEPFCYVTTTGRRTGRPHEIEIWFALIGESLYLISGGNDRADWVRNLLREPAASVRLGKNALRGSARLPLEAGSERDRAIEALHGKYASQVSGTLEAWKREAYIVALDLAPQAT